MSAIRQAFGDVTNRPVVGITSNIEKATTTTTNNVFLSTEQQQQQEQQEETSLLYPESMLCLRREKCFALSDFDMMPRKLGMGKFGEVFKVRETQSRKVLVIKRVRKEALLEEGVVRQFQREVETHVRLHHPNIVKMFSYFHNEDSCFLVLEYANGGSLFERLSSLPKKRTTEALAAGYVRQLCSALAYLHKRGVLHRDIKPENLLLVLENSKEKLKLADFGWTVAHRKNGHRTTLCGTPEYLPPEVCANEEYGTAFDMYTVGVLLYEMLVGASPFAGETQEENTLEALQARILQGHVRFPALLSTGAKTLIHSLLHLNPSYRPSAVEVLRDAWVVKHAGHTEESEWNY